MSHPNTSQLDYFMFNDEVGTEKMAWLCWTMDIDMYSFRCHHWRYWEVYGSRERKRICAKCGWHWTEKHGWHPWDWKPDETS